MLPAIRQELALHRSASTADGAPSWCLYDPVRNLFFHLDWLSFEILSRWHLGDAQRILERVDHETTIETHPEDIDAVVAFLHSNQLLHQSGARSTAGLTELEAKQRLGWWRWLLHRYLFFRVPLLKPDAWLARWLPATDLFFTRGFRIATLLALLTGLVLVSRQWDTFKTTMIDTFSPSAVFAYLATLVVVKFLHELGHAFTAKRMGCHVPTIGVAFLVLFPLAYTDVNDAWKLREKRERLAVGAAGIMVELMLAAWATLAWAVLPEGTLRGAVFLLATTTWVSTLIINASPFMRFDGYFLLMDFLEMPNLHQRSFALGRWQLRQWLFGVPEPRPEELPRRRHAGIVAFAWLVWVYRTIVFTGIALLVYHFFPKPLGPFLAATELCWFLLFPAWREVSTWGGYARAGLKGKGHRRWLWLVAGLLLFLFLPWDVRIKSQGVLKPSEYYTVIAPGGARLVSLPGDGTPVQRGELLAELDVPQLRSKEVATAARAETMRWKTVVASLDPEDHSRRGVLAADRDRVEAELAGIKSELLRYRMQSPLQGRFFRRDPDIREGAWIAENEVLGRVEGDAGWQVRTYVPEAELKRIQVGDRGRFLSETPGTLSLSLIVRHIDRDAVHLLGEPQLASVHGGELPVRETEQGLVPETSHYRITLEVSGDYQPPVPRELRGHVILYGDPRGLMTEYLRAAAAIVVREAGF